MIIAQVFLTICLVVFFSFCMALWETAQEEKNWRQEAAERK